MCVNFSSFTVFTAFLLANILLRCFSVISVIFAVFGHFGGVYFGDRADFKPYRMKDATLGSISLLKIFPHPIVSKIFCVLAINNCNPMYVTDRQTHRPSPCLMPLHAYVSG